MNRLLIAIVIILVWSIYIPLPKALAQGTSTFQINVPRKNVVGQLPISRLKATISLSTDAAVAFEISDPQGITHRIPSAGSLLPGSPAPPFVEMCGIPCNPPLGAVGVDTVNIVPPSGGLPVDDPARKRYVIWIELNSDYNAGAFCVNTMPVASEPWTIAVTTSSPASPNITGVCLQSFDLNIPGNLCGVVERLVPLNEPVASVIGFPDPTNVCLEERSAVDAILVLDKSGSMNNSTLGGTLGSKIEALREAVTDFVNVWDNLRTREGVGAPSDQIGLVFFDSNEHWMDDVSVPEWSSIADGLHNFDTIRSDIVNHINDVNAGGSTSMGDGLIAAANAFDLTNDHRKVILILSNGKENATMRVRVDDPANPAQVQTYTSGNPVGATPLPNQDQFQIYSVTVGTSVAVSADINEDIATATGGFYINTEDNAELLRPFFLELLQNFLKFNTWETVRMISEKVLRSESYSAEFPVTSTTRSLALNLMWNRQLGVLRLTVTPPGASPIVRTGNGSIRLNLELPIEPHFDPTGNFSILVELIDPLGHVNEIPFDLVVLGDDMAVKSDLSIVESDYVPGDQIILQAKVTESGKPVLNIGSNPEDKLLVQLVKPGVGIGDLLSDSGAGTDQPNPDDTMTDADAKLYNELQEHPDRLVRNPDSITLLDNGDLSNGDDVDGDGIYSGIYHVQEPGHYNFLFALEGTTQDAGRFSRQQLKTIHVRSVPDAERTEIQTNIQQTADGNAMIIEMTPRTKFGHLMGPGWANYFWFTTSDKVPFKAQDNLDGTYTARLFFSDDTPPLVSVHFLRVSVVIEDSVTPDKLPVSLDGGTVLIEDINVSGTTVDPLFWVILVILIVLIVVGIVIFLIKKKKIVP